MTFRLSKVSLLIIAVGAILMLAGHKQKKNSLAQASLTRFLQETRKTEAQLKSRLNSKKLAIKSVRNFFNASQNVNENEFILFTNEIINDHKFDTLCFMNPDGIVMANPVSNQSICKRFQTINEIDFVPESSRIILGETVETQSGQAGIVFGVLAVGSGFLNQLESSRLSIKLVPSGHVKKRDSSLYQYTGHRKPLLQSGGVGYGVLIEGRKDVYHLNPGFDYYLLIILLMFLVILSLYTLESSIKKENEISKKLNEKSEELEKIYAQSALKSKIGEKSQYFAALAELIHHIGDELSGPIQILVDEFEKFDKAENKDKLQNIEHLNECLKRIEMLSAGLQSFSNRSPNLTGFDLQAVVQQSVELVSDIYRTKNLELVNKLNKDRDSIQLKGDRVQFQQLFFNLLSNIHSKLGNLKTVVEIDGGGNSDCYQLTLCFSCIPSNGKKNSKQINEELEQDYIIQLIAKKISQLWLGQIEFTCQRNEDLRVELLLPLSQQEGVERGEGAV